MATMAVITGTRYLTRTLVGYALGIEQVGAAEPYTDEELLAQLRQPGCNGRLATYNCEGPDQLYMGYIIYVMRDRRVHIVRLVVPPAWRRRGIARQLVDYLIGRLSAHGRCRILVDVPETDVHLGLMNFFAAMGFKSRTHHGGYGQPDSVFFEYCQAPDCHEAGVWYDVSTRD